VCDYREVLQAPAGPTEELREFYIGYVDAALWSSSDCHPVTGEILESLEGFEPSIEFKQKAFSDCHAFWHTHFGLLQTLCIDYNTYWAQHGHDLWLTRNGHGAGYWDRNYGMVGERLTEAATALGEMSLYLGDDLLVYPA
jgi:hypothetical protein